MNRANLFDEEDDDSIFSKPQKKIEKPKPIVSEPKISIIASKPP